ncbi:MAG: PT domain-containing protein, partial [Lachnospiraceae bacterium]|nr:PT domain-containing protein [Lachnospiraceae bacterium]
TTNSEYSKKDSFPVLKGTKVYDTTNCKGESVYSNKDEIVHFEEVIEGKSATCKNTGLTDGIKCSACYEIILAQETIPATGEHNYENGSCTDCGVAEPTEPPTEAPTEAPTKAPTETPTEAPTEIVVKTDGYYVTGDINLKLTPSGTGKVRGTIALQAGTYNIKLNNYGTLLGYKKTVTNSSNGLTFKKTYSSFVTLNATGGTYTFQVNVDTNTLVIKYDSKLPEEYLVGDVNTILSPVAGKPLAIGTTYLEAGTYQFKISDDAVLLGNGGNCTDDTAGRSVTFKNTYSKSYTLNATGGNYTFTYYTSTDKLIIKHSPVKDEALDDVHLSGDINLVLDDNNGDSNIATGTITLTEGTYAFKVFNYGLAVTVGSKITDKGTKKLYGNYSTPLTLIASGGTYTFSFNKTTNELTVTAAK